MKAFSKIRALISGIYKGLDGNSGVSNKGKQFERWLESTM
jgi:hypothetical protein